MRKLKVPKINSKVTFTGVPDFIYPNFISMKNFAKNNLTIGQKYEVEKVEANSSWVTIYLKEFPDQMFNLIMFDFDDFQEI